MKVMEHNTIVCKASLHPHGHQQQHEGPWSLRIGVKSQPMVVHDWEAKRVLLNIEQPNEEDNFTLIRVMFLKSGRKKPSFVAGCKFHRARWYRRSDEVIEVRLKRRLGSSFQHPVPVGKYEGSCMYEADGGFAVFTLQAKTLRRAPKPPMPKTIITPGDAEYGVALRDAAKSLSRTYGVEGGRADTSGLRDGELSDSVPPRGSGEGVGRPMRTPRNR